MTNFALIASSDSPGVHYILKALSLEGFEPHSIYWLNPSIRKTFRRVKNRAKYSPLTFASSKYYLKRLIALLGHNLPATSKVIGSQNSIDDHYSVSSSVNQYYLDNIHDICTLNCHDHDLFLAYTDDYIPSVVLQIPRIGTLNAHPALLPQFRGLNSPARMIEATNRLSISLHFIDEGIDTGDTVLYIDVPSSCLMNKESIDSAIIHHQALAFLEALKILKNGATLTPVDTFLEHSSLL